MVNFRNIKFKTVIIFLIPIILGTAAFYNDAGKDLYAFIKKITYSDDIEKLSKVNIGQNIEYIESLFGKAATITKLPSDADSQYDFVFFCDNAKRPKAVNLSKYTERIYISTLYYLRVITDKTGTVVFYAVTTRVKDFNPPLPSCFYSGNDGKDLKLGKMRFSDYDLLPLVSYFSDGSGEHLLYEEQYYFIRVGKHCFLSHTSAGYEFIENLEHKIIKLKIDHACSDSDDRSRFGFNGTLTNRFQRSALAGEIMTEITPKDVIAIRSTDMPNTYAVGEDYGHDDLMRYLFQNTSGIGPDYSIKKN